MKTKHWIFALMTVSGLLTGCSSTPTKEQIAKDEVKATEVRVNAEKEMREKEQKRMEAEISQVPSWALKDVKPDETGIYAVGMAESDKVRVALRKAILESEFGLAKNFNQELSGSERLYSQDNNGTVGKEQYTALIDKLVSQVPIVGFEIIKQEVKAIDGKYNAFVLVKLPYSQFNHVLQEQRAKAEDKTIEKAFDDLERRVNNRRKQLAEDARQQKQDAADYETKRQKIDAQSNDAKPVIEKSTPAPVASAPKQEEPIIAKKQDEAKTDPVKSTSDGF